MIQGASTYANLYIGGFAGGSSGQIRQSYAIANLSVLDIRGVDGVKLGGFVSENSGTIRGSYCETAIISAGAKTYGFSSSSGSVSGCYYLSGGTYAYLDGVYLYDFDQGVSGASAVTDEELSALSMTGFRTVNGAHTFLHSQTTADADAAYPYPGVVLGADGRAVHYGDWAVKADLGTIGMVYWEHETNGPNSGYHFSYHGFEGGVEKQGSSLCTAHDDGGIITEYGYGYYWKGTTKPTLTAAMDNGTFQLGSEVTEVSQELAKQIPGFNFVVYQTGEKGLRLESDRTANGNVGAEGKRRDVPLLCVPLLCRRLYLSGLSGHHEEH